VTGENMRVFIKTEYLKPGDKNYTSDIAGCSYVQKITYSV
jgi:hypothetical protein